MKKHLLTKRVAACAFKTSLPVLAGYTVLGIGFGILLQKAGYGVIWAVVMSITIYSGTMQYLGATLIAEAASPLTAVITTLMVNIRYAFYGIPMIKHYSGTGLKKGYLIFSLTDETYSLLCGGSYPDGEDKHTYQFLVSLFNHIYWIVGSVLGNVMSSAIAFDSKGVEFSMTAIFIATFAEMFRKKENRAPAAIGVLISVICLLLFGAEYFLIPTMMLIVLALFALRKIIYRGGEANE